MGQAWGGLTVKPEQWNNLIATFPETHVLQTWEWGQVKRRFGWQPLYLVWLNDNTSTVILTEKENTSANKDIWSDPQEVQAAALALQRNISTKGIDLRASVIYVPKGPLLRDWGDVTLRQRVLLDLEKLARDRGAIFIKIDPDVDLRTGEGEVIPSPVSGVASAPSESSLGEQVVDDLIKFGWRFSPEQVQFRNTVLVDLRPSEEEILAHMKQKTRYNIRLAGRKGVQIRQATLEDLNLLYKMYAETSARDGFVIRDETYYRHLWSTFMKPHLQGMADTSIPHAETLIAEVEGEPLAAVVIFRFADKAWYMFGMSREAHREKMPNHLLQWEAMRRAKTMGCVTYDLWGAPDQFDPQDPLWGVYRFKEGFGGQLVEHIGAWDYPARPFYYALYMHFIPNLLEVMRWRGKARVRRLVRNPAI